MNYPRCTGGPIRFDVRCSGQNDTYGEYPHEGGLPGFGCPEHMKETSKQEPREQYEARRGTHTT